MALLSPGSHSVAIQWTPAVSSATLYQQNLPPLAQVNKVIKLVTVLPHKTYHILLLSYIYEWMFTDFRALLLKNMHRQTPISNQMRRHECNYVLIRTNY